MLIAELPTGSPIGDGDQTLRDESAKADMEGIDGVRRGIRRGLFWDSQDEKRKNLLKGDKEIAVPLSKLVYFDRI